jgi:hypothetical protein
MVRHDLPPIHPGEFLRETLEQLDISQAQFARTIGVAPMRISHVVKGTRSGYRGIGPAVRACLGSITAILAQPSRRVRLEDCRANP